MTPAPPAWRRLAPYFGANILFGAGLWGHAFLYNFYLQELGFDEGVFGLAAAALTAGGLTALAPAGIVLDRVGARRAFLGAVCTAAIGLTAGAFVETRSGIYTAAFVAGMGAAAWRVTMGPVLLDLVDGRTRARAFSWNVALLLGSGALWTLGAGRGTDWITSVAGGEALTGLRWILAAGGAVTLLAAPAFLLVRVPSPTTLEPESAPTPKRAAKAFMLPPHLTAMVGFVLVWMIAGGMVLPFFNVFFQRTYDLSVASIGTLFAAVQIVTALALFGAGEVAGRSGPSRALIGWSLVFAPALGLLALGGPLVAAIGLYAVAGLVPPATNPLVDQILLEEAEAASRGLVSSWRNGATELSGFIGASAGGFLLRAWGFPGLFAAAGSISLLGAALMIGWLRSRGRETTS